jgi:uncharacterized protein YkwD
MQDESPERRSFLAALLARLQHLGLARATLLALGSVLIVFASTFLVTLGFEGEPTSDAAQPPASNASDGDSSVTSDEGDELAVAFAKVDGDALLTGMMQAIAAIQPTPTPTPVPTATPAPTPRPAAPSYNPPAAPPAAPPDDDPSPPQPSGCPTAGMSSMAQALFNAINSQRTQNGLAPLASHGCVVYVAKIRSDDMAANCYFSHTSPNGSTAFSLMDQYGVPYGWAGENLAKNNYPDSESVNVAINALMNSPGHRANILSPNYTHIGVAVSVTGNGACAQDGPGMKYYTMVFIGPG